MSTGPLPQYKPDQLARPGTIEAYLQELVTAIEARISAVEMASGRQKYDVTNVTHTTALDCSSADLDTTRNVLGSLISDLKRSSRLV